MANFVAVSVADNKNPLEYQWVMKSEGGADGNDLRSDPFLHWLLCKKNKNAADAALNVF